MSRLFDPNRVYDDGASAPHTPGQRMMDHRGWEYMFVRANQANITVSHTCVIQNNGQTAQDDNDDNCRCWQAVWGCACQAIPHNSYGWLCIWGSGPINVAASCSADAHLYTSGTTGRLDDTSTSQSRIKGIGLTQNRSGSAGLANAIWCYPVCD